MELLKKLTGKNPAEFEPAAKQLVDKPDLALFKELVARDDYMFGFIKQNVAKRILNACNETNYRNLYQFLEYYSPYYEDVIVSVLSRYDEENARVKMLELLSSGSDDEKCYAAKYFVQSPDSAAADILRGYIFSENEYLSVNSIDALKKLNDRQAYDIALGKLDSNDDYEVYSGVKLLARWGDTALIDRLFEIMKRSSVPEYIALEINTLMPFVDSITGEYSENIALALCHILSGLSELIPLDAVFELNLAEILEKLAESEESSAAVVLMMAKALFAEISGNDEYLFDLDKNTREEVARVHEILSRIPAKMFESGILEEAYENSPFIVFVIDYINDFQTLKALLDGNNQTVILKSMERLKSIELLDNDTKALGLAHITNENIKSVAEAL